MKKRNSRPSGFTLLELLTVIAIIAILAGMIFTGIKNALLKAEIAKAQQGVSSVATALRHYYTEYGKWPIVDPSAQPPPNTAYEDFIVDKAMVALLTGDNVGDPSSVNFPASPKAHIDDLSGSYPQSSTATIQGNPRKIPFLEFKKTDIDPDPAKGYFLDPWGRPYHFRLDVTYQNQVDYPFAAAGKTLPGVGFLVWSVGPDGQYNRSDTVVTVAPLVVQPVDAKNKDNVVSW
jgi:prepilin-type N-terminal cleavage/methylation domain-containing protein